MPNTLIQYQVLIASLEESKDEWECCKDAFAVFSRSCNRSLRTSFHPIRRVLAPGKGFFDEGREDVALQECDYAVFILPEFWASWPNRETTSRLQELWELAESLYDVVRLRNIFLLFKTAPERHGQDEQQEFQSTLYFEGKPHTGKRFTSWRISSIAQLPKALDRVLLSCLTRINLQYANFSTTWEVSLVVDKSDASEQNDFSYWISEARRLSDRDVAQYHDSLFCTSKALHTALTEVDWAKAKIANGIVQFRLNDISGAYASFSEVVSKLSTRDDVDGIVWLGIARLDQATILQELRRDSDAIAACDYLSTQLQEFSEVPLRVLWARVMLKMASTFSQMKQETDAITVLDKVVARLGSAEERDLLEMAGVALADKKLVYLRDNKVIEAMGVCDDILVLFRHSKEPALRDMAVEMLLDMGRRLGLRELRTEEVAIYDTLVKNFGAVVDIPCRELVATALLRKADALKVLGHLEIRRQVLAEILSRYGDESEKELQIIVAYALINYGVALATIEREIDAIDIYDDLVTRFLSSSVEPLRFGAVEGLFWKGTTLVKLGRDDEALETFDEVLAHSLPLFRQDIPEIAAYALLHKAAILGRTDRVGDAILTLEKIMERLESATAWSMEEILVAAMFNKVCYLDGLARGDERIELCNLIVNRFGERYGTFESFVSKALLKKAITLDTLNRWAEAELAYDKLLLVLETKNETDVQLLVANALFNKGALFARTTREGDALTICTGVLDRFGHSTEPTLVAMVERATILREKLLNERAAIGT